MRRALILLRTFRRGLLLAAAASLVACAPNVGEPYLRAKAAGDRAYSAGRLDEAARGYHEAAAAARRPRDRDEATFLEASTYERAHEWAKATEVFAKLAAQNPPGERTARAAFELAEIQLQTGRVDEGFAALERAFRAHPGAGSARKAVHRFLEHLDERGGAKAALDWLDATIPSMQSTELGERLAYERAARLEALGETQAARDAFVACSERWSYPLGALFDDALWRASLLDEKLGRIDRAIGDLRAMLRFREVSTMTGSYERPRFSPAQMRLAVLYRDGLHDHASARRELHRLYTDHTRSVLRDDALWEEAKLAKEDGDAGEACSLVRTLIGDFPDSRYVPCARTLCESAAVPEKAGRCHPYVERTDAAAEVARPSP